MNASPPLIDSNIFVYVNDNAAGAKQAQAETAVRQWWGQGRITQQVLGETYAALTRKKIVPASLALEIILKMREGFLVLKYETQDVLEGARLHGEYGVPIWDGVLAATARRFGITRILTENTKHFERVPDIQAENPLETV